MQKKVKVLQVFDYISHNSGVSAVVMNYYRHLSKERFQCDFMLFGEPEKEWKKELEENESKIFTVGKPSARNMYHYRKAVKKFFKEHGKEYDVVHIHTPNTAFLVLKYAKKSGVKTRIIHSHSSKGSDGIIKRSRNRILNYLGVYYANKYFACSVQAGRYLYGKKRSDSGQVTILKNAIEVDRFQYDEKKRRELRERLGMENKYVIGHVGRFTETKNHKFILEVFREYLQENANTKLLLIGDGELYDETVSFAKKLGIYDDILFLGMINNVSDYLNVMDVFILPSLYEGLPVVCVEAQANSLPCIVSTNVTREIALTEKVIFLENNSDEWLKTIQKTSVHRELRKGNIKMPDYDINEQAKILENYYCNC